VGKTIINHPFGNGLCNTTMVKLGMVYDWFTTIWDLSFGFNMIYTGLMEFI
jgi:hypothetical protein